MKRILLTSALLFGLSVPAAALTFTLNNDNCSGGGCGAATYGTATITQGGTGVDFNISLTSGVFQLTAGNGLTTVNFGFTGQTFLATDLVINSFNGPATNWALVQPNPNNDGFGDFLQGINGDAIANGVNSGGTLLNFTILGAALANLAFSQNGGESTQIAVDLLGPNGQTGLIGGTPGGSPPPPPPAIPLPGTVWLLGTVLLGGAALMRRRRKERA